MYIRKRSRRQKHTVRLNVAAELIAAYAELSEDCKEMFESFLALQVYGEEGMHPYLAPGDPWGTEVPSSTPEDPRFILHEPWSNWAQQIRESSLTIFERREAVRAMLGAPIRHKDDMRLTGLDLREAAKTTLGWTQWDAKHLEWLMRTLGVTTLSEHYAWIQKNVDERWAKGGVPGIVDPALDE
jgi:hypothetical protein